MTSVAVVTGAARGLGLAIATALARDGMTVHLTDVDGAAAEHAAAGLGGECWASALDVRDERACRAAAAATIERSGRLDVWVNNAGLLAVGPSWSHEVEERQLLFDVNVHGTINGTLAALEHMRERGGGHVVNIVSLAGLTAPPGETLYAASKHACLAFSVGTYHDLRQAGLADVHVSAVCPDGIWTPMLAQLIDDPGAAMSWSGTLLQPEQVADVVMGLLARPRPVRSIPRWRGGVSRLAALAPRAAGAAARRIVADATRRQSSWRERMRDAV